MAVIAAERLLEDLWLRVETANPNGERLAWPMKHPWARPREAAKSNPA